MFDFVKIYFSDETAEIIHQLSQLSLSLLRIAEHLKCLASAPVPAFIHTHIRAEQAHFRVMPRQCKAVERSPHLELRANILTKCLRKGSGWLLLCLFRNLINRCICMCEREFWIVHFFFTSYFLHACGSSKRADPKTGFMSTQCLLLLNTQIKSRLINISMWSLAYFAK